MPKKSSSSARELRGANKHGIGGDCGAYYLVDPAEQRASLKRQGYVEKYTGSNKPWPPNSFVSPPLERELAGGKPLIDVPTQRRLKEHPKQRAAAKKADR